MSEQDQTFQIAKTLYDQREYAKSTQLFESLTSDPCLGADAEVYLGLIALVSLNSEQAREYFSSALVLDPRSVAALLNLGDLSFNEKNYPAARSAYEAVRSIDPKRSDAQARLLELDDIQHSRDPYIGDIYDKLREQDDEYCVAAVRLIEKNKMKVEGLRLAAYRFPDMMSKLGLVLLIAVIIALGVALNRPAPASASYQPYADPQLALLQRNAEVTRAGLAEAKRSLASATNPALRSQEAQIVNECQIQLDNAIRQLNAATDEANNRDRLNAQRENGSARQSATTMRSAQTFGVLLLIIIFAIAFLAYELWRMSIKRTIVEIDRGYIKITSGVFTRTMKQIEITHAQFDVHQFLMNESDGEGALVLNISGEKKKEITLRGLAKNDVLLQLAANLRSLSLALKSTPIGRGIYNV